MNRLPLSGDHIVEQHVHDLDVINWCKNGHPISANGMGGRQVRIGKDYGEIFDHHSVEVTYADGSKSLSFSRHIPNCWKSFSQHFHRTRGTASIQGHGMAVLDISVMRTRVRGAEEEPYHGSSFVQTTHFKLQTSYSQSRWRINR